MADQVTLRDIAEESGYSIAAVSLALRHKPGVSDTTREHILAVAETLGYPLKGSEEADPSGELKNLGLIVKSEPENPPRANPFYSRILVGIEDVCRRGDINLLYAKILVDSNNHPVQIPKLLSHSELDGLLIVGAFIDEAVTSQLEDQLQIPVVLVDAYAANKAYDAVVSDNFSGAYTAVKYLIDQGHRHIGMLGGCQSTYPSLRERRRGYEQALLDYEIARPYLTDCTLRPDDAFDVTQELLTNSGYQVLKARGGHQALDIFRHHLNEIDLVILDMIMPGMNGAETYDQLKELDPSVKVILTSGYSLDGQAERLFAKGCNGFLQKPFSIDSLSQKISEVMQRTAS